MNRMIYVKTTETCQLNCKHCFTNGINGAKIYFNPHKTADWVKRLHSEAYKENDTMHFEFHGGEPFLAPVSHMRIFYEETKDLWPNASFGITSNLTFKLKDEHWDFIKGPLGNRMGTSWDPKIRFENEKQEKLWENNVKELIKQGVIIKLFISVTKDTVNIEPIELLKWVKDLGVQEMALERLTGNGNALLHPEIFPTNLEQDAWFLKMHEQIVEHDARHWFDNEFMETIYNKFESGFLKGGTFCRDCEEKLYTINADGSLSGCPNAAPEEQFGHIDDDIKSLINSPRRIKNIACERSRDPRCYECPVFMYCGGDCHQLAWQGDICGAPKSLMKLLKAQKHGN
jgi:radical SAM protein with 4Fe4S-binding SPASM domain